MSAKLNLLLICQDHRACPHFVNHLEREGCHAILACDTEDAARVLLGGGVADVVLIHHQTIAGASIISSALKVICPLMPMILITVEWPKNGVLPEGVDAVCCANSLGRRAARDIVRFVRYLLAEQPNQRLDNPRYDDGRFVPQKPNYLN